MNWQTALRSVGVMLAMAGALCVCRLGQASSGDESRDGFAGRPQKWHHVAQKKMEKDPETDPGGLPGMRPDSNPSPGDRDRALQGRSYNSKKIPDPPAARKPDRTLPDKPKVAPQ